MKKKTWNVAFAASDEDYLTDEELAALRFKQGIVKRLTSRLRERRKERNVTQKELAEGTGISESKIKKLESNGNETLPSVPELARISDYYGFSMDYFCRDKIKKTDKENAVRYTGLSENAVRYLHNLKPQERAVLDSILNKESGLDIILQNIDEAHAAAANVPLIQTRLDFAILGYRHAQTERCNTVIEPKTGKVEKSIVPAENRYQLQNRRDDIRLQLDLLQLQEYKQESNRHKIRTVVEQILDKLIPSAKSELFPDIEKTRKEVLGK